MVKQQTIDIINQITKIITGLPDFESKKMFGGSAFLMNGHMTVGEFKGHLILRLSKDDYQEVMGFTAFKPFDITGKNMKGWAMLEGESLIPSDYDYCVNKSIEFVKTLPVKKK